MSISIAMQRPVPLALRNQRLAEDPFENHAQLGADLRLLVGGEDVHNSVDGGRRTVGMKRGERQVARFRNAQRRFHRFQVSHFSDQHHIRIFAQCHPECIGKRMGIGTDLALVDDAVFVG